MKLTGISAGAYALTRCLGGCTGSPSQAYPTPPTNVNFTIDTWLPAYSALKSAGGYVYYQGIIIACTSAGNYIAVSEYCTHQGTSVVYQGSNNDFFCSAHSATFAYTGGVVSGPVTVALRQYKAVGTPTINGYTVTVTG